MAVSRWDRGFFESTRGKVVGLLRRGTRTVDELANALGVTDNAVRAHLAALERDGLIRQRGVRPTGGKPAFSYEMAPEAERLFTKAYIPVLTQLVGVLSERMEVAELEALLREVGLRIAMAGDSATGDLRARAETAATVLTELGGIVDVEDADGTLTLQGYSCPLADAVRAHPATCHAVQALVAELMGVPVTECCDKGDQPRCRFTLGDSSPAQARGSSGP